MQDWMNALLDLQDLDMKVAKLEELLAEVPKKAEETRAMYFAEEAAFQEAKKNCQDGELTVRKLEKDIAAVREQKKNLLSKSSMIKNNTEYRAAMLQIEMCDHTVSEYETNQLEAMDKLDALKQTMAQKEQALNEAKHRAEGVIEDLRTRQTNCKTALTELAEKRKEFVPLVEPTVLARYERLRTAKNHVKTRPCFVPLEEIQQDGARVCVCGRCRVKLPTQLLSNVKKGQLATCSSCAALLYYSE